MIRAHVWRVDADTPAEQHPWILSWEGHGEPLAFTTFGEAFTVAHRLDVCPACDVVGVSHDEGNVPVCLSCGWDPYTEALRASA